MSIKDNLSILAQNKIFAHLGRIQEWKETGSTWPVTVELDPINICNHRCPQCAGGRYPKNASLSKEQLKRNIEAVSPFCKGLIFTGGGEPLCNRYTIWAVKYAKSRGMKIGFISNGGLLTEKSAETLVKNCDWVRISLDASTPEMFRVTHGMSEKEFNRVCNNILILTQARDRLKSKCIIGTAFLTSKKTLSGMYDFVLLAKRLKVNYAQFRPFHYDKTNVLEEVEKCKTEETDDFKVIASVHKYQLILEQGWLRKYQICFGHHFATVIGADNKIYLCCHMRGKEKYCLGDLNVNSFKDIWTSKQRRKAYQTIDFKDCPPMCRCDTFNQILWDIYQLNKNGTHLEFL